MFLLKPPNSLQSLKRKLKMRKNQAHQKIMKIPRRKRKKARRIIQKRVTLQRKRKIEWVRLHGKNYKENKRNMLRIQRNRTINTTNMINMINMINQIKDTRTTREGTTIKTIIINPLEINPLIQRIINRLKAIIKKRISKIKQRKIIKINAKKNQKQKKIISKICILLGLPERNKLFLSIILLVKRSPLSEGKNL